MPDLAGRRVLVTGAARGLGAALARALADRGARLALVGVEPDLLGAVADELGAPWWEADVRDRLALTAAVDAAAANYGGLDVVVANAGVISFGTVAGQPPEDFERVLDVNLRGTYYTARAAVPHLVGTHGYLLVMASLATAFQAPAQAQYAASKAGVAAFAQSLRLELKPDRVDVGVVHPIFVATDMVTRDTVADPVGQAVWRGNRGLRAPVSVDEVVGAMLGAIERRQRRVVVPKRLTPLVLAPGVFQPALEVLWFRRGQVRRVLDAERRRTAR